MNVGPAEIVIVLVLALLIFGPKQLPQMGRTLGRGVREFRHAADSARTELGLDDITAELGKAKSGLDDIKAGVDVKGAIIGPSPTPAPPTPGLKKEPAGAEGEAQATETPAAEKAGDTQTPEAPTTEAVVGTQTPEAPHAGDAPQPDASTAPGA